MARVFPFAIGSLDGRADVFRSCSEMDRAVIESAERDEGIADKCLYSKRMSVPAEDAARAASARRFADRKAKRTMSASITSPIIDRPPAPAWAASPATAVTTICHPVYQHGLGGLESRLLGLIDGLPADRFRHVVVVRGHTAQQVQIECERPAGNVCLIRDPSTGRDPLGARRLGNIVREQSVDVLHIRGLAMLQDAVPAARRAPGARIAFSFPGFEQHDRRIGRLRRALYRRAIMRCDARWAESDAAARAIANELEIDRSFLDIVPDGVDTDRFAPTVRRFTIRRILDLSPERLILLTVASTGSVNGQLVLLDALAGMRKYAPRITVVMVGGECLDGDLQARAARQCSGFDIRLVGEQADVRPWLQSADLFVSPYLTHGRSNSLLEAMACELPTIAAKVDGGANVIDHGESGLLIAPGDPLELASAIEFMLEDRDARFRLGAAGRRAVLQNHNADDCVRRYGERYAALSGKSETDAHPERDPV